jgi:hypothetical protein
MKLVQQGGFKEDLIHMLSKASFEFRISFMIILVLSIVFNEKIPRSIANTASTTYGRILLFAFVIGITYIDWPSSILGVILSLLLIVRGTPTFLEGFVPDIGDTLEYVGDKPRWWSEIVLKENPIAIEDTKVKTIAVQDDDEEDSNTVQDSHAQENSSFA